MTEYAERPNKTRQKREWAGIRVLAEQLTTLEEGVLAGFDLDPRTLEAIRQARALKACGARNRQLKFIARLLQGEDLDAIKVHFTHCGQRRDREKRAFHALEQWRERLLREGDQALQDLLQQYPHIQRQALRQAMMAAVRERQTGKPAGAGKKLFRLLREHLSGDV